jgi:hypothetical protein
MRAYLVRRWYDRRQELIVEVAALKERAKLYHIALNAPEVEARAALRRANTVRHQQVEERRTRLNERLVRRKAENRYGYVYVLKTFAGLYKIGKTRDLKKRLEGYAIIGDGAFELIHSFPCDDHHAAERLVHERLAHGRVGQRELFNLSENEVVWLCSIKQLKAREALPDMA